MKIRHLKDPTTKNPWTIVFYILGILTGAVIIAYLRTKGIPI